jgi:hypothetical protein
MSDNKALPLKLKDSDGKLQQISSSEKNYLAYLVGLHTAVADSDDIGLLTLTSTNNRLIGTLTDTYYPEAVGTHPYDQQSVITTNTSLYQITGTASETDSDFRRPIGHYETNVYEMNDTSLNALVDDLNKRIAVSDYPGSLKLASSRPSTDYDILIPNLMTDQRADSNGNAYTINEYSVWRRTSMSAPTSIRDDRNGESHIMGLKRSNGDSGDFQGLQKLTDRQVQVTIGQRAKTRRAIQDNVGSYLIRTATQGAPTNGTWKAVGSAINTIRLVDEQNYTRTRASAYSRDRSSVYSDTYTRTRNTTFVGDYTGNFARDFIGNYSRNFIGNYAGEYTGNFTGEFTGNYTRDRVTEFSDVYSRTRSSNYIGDYTRDFIGNYNRSFIGNYSGEYNRTSTRNRDSVFSRNRASTYTRNSSFAGNYVSTFAGNYAGNYIGNFSSVSVRTRNSIYSRTSTRTRTSSYEGAYVGEYARTVGFTRNSTRTRTSNFTSTRICAITCICGYTSPCILTNEITRECVG